MHNIIFEGDKGETGCGYDCFCKIWKQGHSFKCRDKQDNKYKTVIRYWQPKPSIFASLIDNCTTCHRSTEENLRKMKDALPKTDTSVTEAP